MIIASEVLTVAFGVVWFHRVDRMPNSSETTRSYFDASQTVRASSLAQSIGTASDAYDNTVVGLYCGPTQIELLDRNKSATRLEFFYNQRRRYLWLGNISPVELEKRHLTAA